MERAPAGALEAACCVLLGLTDQIRARLCGFVLSSGLAEPAFVPETIENVWKTVNMKNG